MNNYNSLQVFYEDILVGTLAKTQDNLVAFEYDSDWLSKGFSISPLSLPLVKKVFVPKWEPFNGLYGVFNDTLPDGWGRLLVDRLLLKNKVNPVEINQINRLAIVQQSGMGALSFRPEHKFEVSEFTYNLDDIANECKKILNSEFSDDLDKLFRGAY